ncbi:MAG: YjbH domain-containing protein [Thermodesulfobacteriota bacterium]
MQFLGHYKKQLRHCPATITTFTILSLLLCSVFYPHAPALAGSRSHSASLKPSTGIWQMPNSRVLKDWTLRFKYGNHSPYRYYGAALGLLDRMEVSGKFTEITTLQPFSYDYKDRSMGAKFVVLKEKDKWPQIALGFLDITGTALFSSRYLSASKEFQGLDLTFGLGQGTLAGDPAYPDSGEDKALDFHTSSLIRKTRVFGGLEYDISPRLTLSAEYSSLEPETMQGYRTRSGDRIKRDQSRYPFNFGLKYNYNNLLYMQLALMRGNTIAGGLGAQLPLKPQGMLTWKKSASPSAAEKTRWGAYRADNRELSEIVAHKIHNRGFENIAVSSAKDAVWIQFKNTRHLSDSRALAHVGKLADSLLPPGIETLYLNITAKGSVVQSLRTSRENLRSFLNSSIDREEFLASSRLLLYGDRHWREYQDTPDKSELYQYQDNLSYSINPRLKTFLNNRAGFFKHKGLIELTGNYDWKDLTAYGQLDLTIFNQFDELQWTPLEKEPARTDIIQYKAESRPRLTTLALEYQTSIPYSIQAQVSSGIFSTAYAGLGMELFRYFHDGLWGLGLESQAVRKRDVNNNFQLKKDNSNWYSTAYLNLYAQLWPSQGVECGIKAGRFLAGDPGIRIELRRSFKYFTIGGWTTFTDSSGFDSAKNKRSEDKGVFIRIPFSVFRDRDTPGHFGYSIRSFTRDQGQTVDTPSSLFPLNPWSTPHHTRSNIEEMNRF